MQILTVVIEAHAIRTSSVRHDLGMTASADEVVISMLATEAELDRLQPLWLALLAHERATSAFDGWHQDDATSWRARRATYADWLAAGDALLLVAEQHGAVVGYAAAHLQDGPDDSFAVGDRWAELYSLSVDPAVRGRGTGSRLLDELDARLAQAGVRDLSVAVSIGNDAALRLYRRRGLQPVETVLWRLGGRRP